jgi:hypothetical protein
MLDSLRKLIRPRPAEPCRHTAGLVFDWYKNAGVATCPLCGEVWLASELGEAPPDWSPAEGGFDGP